LLLFFVLLSSCHREELQPIIPDTTAPLSPTGLLVESAHDGYVFFSWVRNTESDLNGYIVYRSEPKLAGVFIPLDTIQVTHFIDGQRSYDTTYSYHVTALDQSGNESQPSDVISSTSPNTNAPESPLYLFAEGHNYSGQQYIRLQWQPVDEYDLKGYFIYRSESPGVQIGNQQPLTFSEQSLFDDTVGLAINKPYYYVITTVDRGDKESVASKELSDFVSAVPALLSPAPNAQVKGQIIFKWSAVTGAAQYFVSVSREEFSDEFWTAVIDNNGSTAYLVPYTGESLYAGRSYYWRVSTRTKKDGSTNAVSEVRLFQSVL